MYYQSHRWTSILAFKLLAEIDSDFKALGWADDDDLLDKVGIETAEIDNEPDLEVVDVAGSTDANPHDESEWIFWGPEYAAITGNYYTAFSHFIDIRKGPGMYDDYDGYSYHHGSGKVGQYEFGDEYLDYMNISDKVEDKWWYTRLIGAGIGGLIGGFFGGPVGAGIGVILGYITLDVIEEVFEHLAPFSGYPVDKMWMWFFDDKFVHAPGHPYYKGCSPAVERYSRWDEVGKYQSREDETLSRFPRTDSDGGKNLGIPYSVFLPVDNLALYWYRKFKQSGSLIDLAGAFHGIQDAVIPHHAAATNGNWHQRYESELEQNYIAPTATIVYERKTDYSSFPTKTTYEPKVVYSYDNIWPNNEEFREGVKDLYTQYNRIDPEIPSFTPDTYHKYTPALNWPIDLMVTWLAMDAFNAYENVWMSYRTPDQKGQEAYDKVMSEFDEEDFAFEPTTSGDEDEEEGVLGEEVYVVDADAASAYSKARTEELNRLFASPEVYVSMRILTQKAVAVSMLVLAKAVLEQKDLIPNPYFLGTVWIGHKG